MPITIARTSPPSGLVSCSLSAACAVSGPTLDANKKAVVRITFNVARMLSYLSEIEFTSVAGFRHPSKRRVPSRTATRRGFLKALSRPIRSRRHSLVFGSSFQGGRLLRTPARQLGVRTRAGRNHRPVLGEAAEAYRHVAMLQKRAQRIDIAAHTTVASAG